MSTAARSTAPREPRVAAKAFAADVQFYLGQDPRQLPSRYLYDDLGSALFEAICRLPWYGLQRAELRLIETHARDILTSHASTTLVELGPGSGDKMATLISSGGPRHGDLDVHLIDVSPGALTQARRTVEAFPNVRIATHESTYEAGIRQLAAYRAAGSRLLVLFLGSNIGNFDPPGREAFLNNLRAALKPGDRLLLGADLVKPEPKLLLAYDDPLGVTAAFNRNLLVRINRELRGDFDLSAFRHRAVWNPAACRVEMHLVSARRQRVEIPAAELRFDMNEGESIWTESSYKYEPADITAVVRGCGFRVVSQWLETHDRFALTLAEAA